MHLLALLALPACTAAASLTLYLPATPNPFALPPTTHATLSTLSEYRSAPLSSVNTFVFHNVTPGSYLADVHCTTDGFRPLRIDVSVDQDGAELIQAWDTFRGNEWGNKGELVPVREGSAGKGVDVKSIGKKMYFMDRPSCMSSSSPALSLGEKKNPSFLRVFESDGEGPCLGSRMRKETNALANKPPPPKSPY